MKIGIVVFPGTWSESDTHYATNDVLGINSEYIWHKDQSLNNTDIIILPGGFSYGDYLRTGAIASFSPIMEKIITFANSGGVVIGICNGFQILCESNLLPGVLMRNNSLSFVCENSYLKVNNDSLFTNQYNQNEIIRIPISHGEGNFQADKKIIDEIEEQNRVIFRYSSKTGETNLDHNPNGSINNIAGITNKQGNVLGLMPHPEKACEKLIGSDDGLGIFKSIMTNSIKK
ncbi:MAG: phosphoribosylformylglycinamidine synthase subunit PurQ [Dehalococcoidia bacterium]|nr:phosphoribosylformylglycinamidine synthase subunit PurQ [Dehalococcoidia bacterium]